ncbi:MAG TPA: family 1 glycosylhydrolase [Chloroflexota bacterium]|nr:family 1 glycosylhydrolase [Chloroflexota bacterium]
MTLQAPFSSDPRAFVWAGGFEDTFVPHPHPGSGRSLDEYLLTGHYEHWRADLDRAASVGFQALRYGIPWYRVNPAPGVFDWTWSDQVIDHATRELGLTIILDLVHYGPPLWLAEGFLNPGYPEAVAAFARSVTQRYADRVRWYTPLNEPLITAEFCGLRGIWPPHQYGDSGFVRVLEPVCRGIVATTAAIRAVDPSIGIAHVECSALYRAGTGARAEDLAHWQARAWLPSDLLTGRVDATHPLASWLETQGLGPEAWSWFVNTPFAPDLWGVNYYPEISVHRLERRGHRLHSQSEDAWAAGLEEALTSTYARYGIPLFVSETSTHGDDARRGAWLADSVAAIARLRGRAIPILGYTWWPLLDLIDWSYGAGAAVIEDFVAHLGYPPQGMPVDHAAAFARQMEWEAVREYPVDRYLRRMGLWRLDRLEGESGFTRSETATAAGLRALIRQGAPSHEGTLDGKNALNTKVAGYRA